jgi:hypothetical protein
MFPSGLWYNELGSMMQLNVSGGNVWGWYYSAVGTAKATYPLSGQINPQPYPFSQVLGWAVAWTNAYANAHSSTSWSGQYQTVDNQEEIVAFWLLTSETQEQDDWEATLVGKDVFTRRMPAPADVDKARKKTAKSHPADANP